MNSFNFKISDIISLWDPVKQLAYNLFFGVKIYSVPLIYILFCIFIFTNCIFVVLHIKFKGSSLIPRGDSGKKDNVKPRYERSN